MPHRLEIASVINTEGERLKRSFGQDLGISVDDVRVLDVYTIDGEPSPAELNRLGRELFADPVTQRYSIDAPLANNPDGVVEIGFWPGVLDAVGKTAQTAQQELLGKGHPTYTSRQYVFKGKITQQQMELIAKYLSNPLIQRSEIHTGDSWKRNSVGIYVPRVTLQDEPKVTVVDLAGMSDEELEKTGRLGIFDHYDEDGKEVRRGPLSLNLEEMKIYRGRFPVTTDGSLETFAQTNSEHCKHKIFAGEIRHTESGQKETIDSLFKTYIRGATDEIRRVSDAWNKRLVSVFTDNAGLIDFGNGYYVAFKVETHNSPSALDPRGGAETGTAVVRDMTGAGKGFRPIAYTDVFCFADPLYAGQLPDRILHPKRVASGVHKGIEDGGNKKGIPVVNGTIRFDSYEMGSAVNNSVEGKPAESYMGKPLVYCGVLGVAPSHVNGESVHIKKADAGDTIVVIGGRVGKDGIHGATFSSEALSEGSPATAVQLADAITEKRNIDFLMEARDAGLYKSITDNGAGGLACSIGEMAKESGGADVHLEKSPLKYAGLQPWEILESESQERMTLAVHPGKLDVFLGLARRRGVEASVLGAFTNSGKFRAYYNDATVVDMDMEFLHNGLPQKKMDSTWKEPGFEEPYFRQPDIDEALANLLGRLNICSKEYFVRRYDHEVQGGTVVKPFTGARNDGPSDAGILWPVEFRKANDFTGLVVSNGINSNYGLIDPYWMAAANIDEAIRNAVVTGADPDFIAILDNFCWSSSDDAHRLGQLVRACKGCYDFSVAYSTPFVSGKDSMFNDYKGKLDGRDVKISVPPTLLISAMGKIPDIRQSVTMDTKQPGSVIYAVGVTKPELGGSEYLALLGSERNEAWIGKSVPKVDAQTARVSYHKLHQAIRSGLVYSAHDVSEGGLLVAVTESAFAGGMGAEIYFDSVPSAGIRRNDYMAFSESQSRLLVEVPERYATAFENCMKGVPHAVVGKTVANDRLVVYGLNGKPVVDSRLQDLKDAWQRTLRW